MLRHVRTASAPAVKLITFSPVATGLALKPIVDQSAADYRERLSAMADLPATVRVPTADRQAPASTYEDLSSDDVDLRLCVFSPPLDVDDETLRIHVFPGAYAIVEYVFPPPEELSAAKIEAHALTRTRAVVGAVREGLDDVMGRLRRALPDDWIEQDEAASDFCIEWTARTLVLSPEELSPHETLIDHWLANTARPGDARDIVDGDRDYSMTWLNYVIASDDPRRIGMLCSAMRISQFFYARQNAINGRARRALAQAFATQDIREAQSLLAGARADIQLLRIQYDTLSSLLNRNKRRVIAGIMEVWDYPTLVDNGHRMVEACTSRIQEISAQRTERSSFVTDLILTVITFLAVIDVLLTLSQYSREVMSRPVLEYQDSDLSWILSGVAAVDTDRVLIGGALSVFTLLLIYAYWKLRK